jgi:hypothetical protein
LPYLYLYTRGGYSLWIFSLNMQYSLQMAWRFLGQKKVNEPLNEIQICV